MGKVMQSGDRGRPRVLLFDFDGVLADTLEDMLRFGREACSQLGHPCQPTREDLEALERMEFVEYGRQLGLPGEKVEEFARRSQALFASRPQPPPTFGGIYEAVVTLSATCKLGVVTGNTRQAVQKFLEDHGLRDYIDIILDSDVAGARSEKVRKAAEELGGAEGDVYVIGDAVSDIRAAGQAGVKSVAVTWGHQSREKLEAAEPDHLVQSPRELVCLLGGG